MGRSVPTARQVLENLAEDLDRMASIMPQSQAAIMHDMVMMGRRHSAEISYSGVDPYTGFLISIIIDLYSRIREAEQ